MGPRPGQTSGLVCIDVALEQCLHCAINLSQYFLNVSVYRVYIHITYIHTYIHKRHVSANNSLCHDSIYLLHQSSLSLSLVSLLFLLLTYMSISQDFSCFILSSERVDNRHGVLQKHTEPR